MVTCCMNWWNGCSLAWGPHLFIQLVPFLPDMGKTGNLFSQQVQLSTDHYTMTPPLSLCSIKFVPLYFNYLYLHYVTIYLSLNWLLYAEGVSGVQLDNLVGEVGLYSYHY